jgi:hypothetical protein
MRIPPLSKWLALYWFTLQTAAWAGIGGPYAADSNTVNLYHCDDAFYDAGTGVMDSSGTHGGTHYNGTLTGSNAWLATSGTGFGGQLQMVRGSGGNPLGGGYSATTSVSQQLYTFEGRFTAYDTTRAQQYLMIGKKSGTVVSRLRLLAGGKLEFGVYKTSWKTVTTGSGAMVANTPCHIAVTYDNNTMKIYVNNVVSGSLGGLNNYLASGTINALVVGMGSSSTEDSRLSGAVDEVRVSNIVRTNFNVATTGSVSVSGGKIYKDGSLWVPKCLYFAQDFTQAVSQGFDLSHPQSFVSNTNSGKVTSAEMQKIDDAKIGFYFDVSTPIIEDTSHGTSYWTDSDKAWIKPIIDRFKDNPSMRFYYLAEPIAAARAYWSYGGSEVIFDRLKKLRGWLHEWDAKHPLWVTHDSQFTKGAGYDTSGAFITGKRWVQETGDVVGLNYYPFRAGAAYGTSGTGFLRALSELLGELKNYASADQPVTADTQAWASSTSDFVARSETRATWATGMALGLNGYAAFAARHTDPAYSLPTDFPTVWAELKTLTDVVNIAGAAISSGTQTRLDTVKDIWYPGVGDTPGDGSDNIEATLYEKDGNRYLVVVNISEVRDESSIRFNPPAWSGKSVEAVSMITGQTYTGVGQVSMNLPHVTGSVYTGDVLYIYYH